MRSVCISSGHGLKIRGASGHLDEVDEARRVVNRVAELLESAKVPVKAFHDDTSTSQSTNLSTIVNWHNKQSRELDCSVHFNAYQTTSKPMGTEVLYVSQQKLASDLSAALAGTMVLTNRGGKRRTDLYFLNNTAKPAILIEVVFVDSSADASAYRGKFDNVCKVIAEFIGDVKLGAPKPPKPPVEPEPPPEVAGRVDLVIQTDGPVTVTINGEEFKLTEQVTDYPTVNLNVTAKDAVVTINGQDYQIDTGTPPTEPPAVVPPAEVVWQTGIETTMFGGAADPNNSAYPPYGYIDDTVFGCALPWKFPGTRPKIRVRNPVNGKEVTCEILDLGPWMISDDYWTRDARPIAEICYFGRQPLPSGPNKGKIPSNAAALDLTPAAAKAIDLQGKATCEWTFVLDEEVA